MSNTRSEADKKLLRQVQEFSELLKSHSYDLADEKAVELKSLLRKRDDYTLAGYMLDMIGQHLKSFDHYNRDVKKAKNNIAGIGRKLEEFN
ncbi:hypothetical protein DIX60_01375 [Streptococcus iniae]|uniref:hypothetical protein n=1 Tax=Streptococcus iniae TaxID=1346 RepID=UPI0002E0B8F1|nr:hypothetical protein [Streptococcus iniae]ESR10139.1 hypothetical protein IUSA1_03200 [Streptococcus iniae IUSA1]KYJ82907.1 hypothetical protein NA30_01330 [Streptococcus iniae]RLV28636.1 hypothetical protein DIX60_01375 [Streptococcus iniae]RMI76824.1 hypothetical protein DIX59_01465 [Streptococcus iniae]HEK4517161.1 hypothetical protein [Streptococcus iniae]